MRGLLLVAAAIAAPLALAAAPAPALAFAADPSAADLAKLVHPVELAVATAMEGADRYLVAAMVKQPEIAALEKEHPGIMKVMYEAGRPFLTEVERRNAVKMQERLAELYAAEFTPAEIVIVHRFFSTPTGRKIVRGMFNPVSVRHTAETVAKNPDGKLSADTLRIGHGAALQEMVAGLTPEDEKLAAAFIETSAGAKVKALPPKVRAIAAEIGNTPHPDIQAKVDAAMIAAADKMMAASAD